MASNSTIKQELTTDTAYQSLLSRISEVYTAGQLRAQQAVNAQLTATYWQIGHDIVEFEQGGKARADYGKALLDTLSRDLTYRHGRGFSRSNVIRIRQFYLTYPKGATASHFLSWSHIVELLKIDDPLERSFYEQQTLREKWAVRTACPVRRVRKAGTRHQSQPERTWIPMSTGGTGLSANPRSRWVPQHHGDVLGMNPQWGLPAGARKRRNPGPCLSQAAEEGGPGSTAKILGPACPRINLFPTTWMSCSTVRSPQTHEPPPRKDAAPRRCAACPVGRVRETGAGHQSKPEGAGLWRVNATKFDRNCRSMANSSALHAARRHDSRRGMRRVA